MDNIIHVKSLGDIFILAYLRKTSKQGPNKTFSVSTITKGHPNTRA
jgi:hypothetical protein